jgi:hypothetical protein
MDMNRFRLRTMLDDLAAVGDLDAHSGATPLSHVARLLQDSDKAVLFEQGGAEGQALVGNVMSSRRRLAQAQCKAVPSLMSCRDKGGRGLSMPTGICLPEILFQSREDYSDLILPKHRPLEG